MKNLNESIKKGDKMAKPKLENWIIYFTVGALGAKFIETVLKIQVGQYWWLSLILGGILGLVILNRKRLFH